MVILVNGMKWNVEFDSDYYLERESKLIMRAIHRTIGAVERHEGIDCEHTLEILRDALEGIATIEPIGDKEEFIF